MNKANSHIDRIFQEKFEEGINKALKYLSCEEVDLMMTEFIYKLLRSTNMIRSCINQSANGVRS